eukprot:Rmarinus@m.18083
MKILYIGVPIAVFALAPHIFRFYNGCRGIPSKWTHPIKGCLVEIHDSCLQFIATLQQKYEEDRVCSYFVPLVPRLLICNAPDAKYVLRRHTEFRKDSLYMGSWFCRLQRCAGPLLSVGRQWKTMRSALTGPPSSELLPACVGVSSISHVHSGAHVPSSAR